MPKSELWDSERTRASTQPKSQNSAEYYQIHRTSLRGLGVTDAELAQVRGLYADLTDNGKRLFHAVVAVSIEDRGYAVPDFGFRVHSFTRAQLAARHRSAAPSGARLYPNDVRALEYLVEHGQLNVWTEPLRQLEYRAPDGTVLRYKSSYQLRYRLAPPAAVFALLRTRARPRIEVMQKYVADGR